MHDRFLRLGLLAVLIALAIPAWGQEESFVRGPLRPHRLAALGVQVEGVVSRIAATEGSMVAAGSVLLELDATINAARIGLARASAAAEGDLRQARIHHQEAVEVLQRTQQASNRAAASEWEVRQARARVEATRAIADAAEEKRQIEMRRLDLEIAQAGQSTIRAPFDGVVTRVDTVIGASLTRADRPITVADLGKLEAILYVPAEFWFRLRTGQSYPLFLPDPVARNVAGVLRHVDPVMDAASGRFRAIFVIDNPDRTIPAGLDAGLDLRDLRP